MIEFPTFYLITRIQRIGLEQRECGNLRNICRVFPITCYLKRKHETL
jgi:hypothetical protein